MRRLAAILFFVSAALTVVAVYVGVGVGAFYHPETAARSWIGFGAFLSAVAGLGALALWQPRRPVWRLLSGLVLLLAGLGLGGVALAYASVGLDAVLWVWPVAAGVCLVVLAVLRLVGGRQ